MGSSFLWLVMTPKEKPDLFVVRLYDGFDNRWIDVSGAVNKDEADRIWREKTQNGKKSTSYNDIDYYRVFPADTRMLYADWSGNSG